MRKIDISLAGGMALQKKLNSLAYRDARLSVFVALKKEAYRTRGRIVENIASIPLVESGVMLGAYQKAKVRSAGRKNLIRVGPENPTRAELGIAPDDKYYYPYAVEFGHVGAPAYPFIRPAIDNHRERSLTSIAADIGAGIEKAALKK